MKYQGTSLQVYMHEPRVLKCKRFLSFVADLNAAKIYFHWWLIEYFNKIYKDQIAAMTDSLTTYATPFV